MLLSVPLASQRLLLRTIAPEEARGAYARWMQDPQVIRYLEVRHQPRDEGALADFIARMNESPDNLLLGIVVKESGFHIGNIKLGPIHAIHRRAAIGIVIGEKGEWGKGYAAEAIESIARHGFAVLGLHRLEAGFYAGNRNSITAFEKAGFRPEGRLAGYWRSDDGWEDHLWMGRVTP